MSLENAERIFKEGKFNDAEKIYSEIIQKDAKNFQALVQLGKIALYSNRFGDAESWLKKAEKVDPKNEQLKSLLVETYYRQDDYQKAASILKQLGKLEAAKRFESFKDVQPLEIVGDTVVTRVKFLKTDPLPILQLSVNDGETVNFFIDTGAAETVLDSEFAKELGLDMFYKRTGTFAGGNQAPIQFSKIDSLNIGDFTIRNIPVNVLPVRHFSDAVFSGTKVDGIIGTNLFYHFITTLDYIQGELILRKKTDQNLTDLDEMITRKKPIVTPFWLAGSHIIVSWGKVNSSKPMLFYVDTGLAGGGFTCPESTLKAANIDLIKEKASTGIGGGGQVQVTPFIAEELSLGNATEKNIRGIHSSGSKIESMAGFHIGGIISHGFFRNYALTFDFSKMRLILNRSNGS